MNRLAEVVAALSTSPALRHAPEPAALPPGDTAVTSTHEPQLSNARLLAVIDRLEKRVLELEDAARRPTILTKSPELNGNKQGVVAVAFPNPAAHELPGTVAEKSDPVALLLGKGQALLNLDQPEKALACFEEILKLEPRHAEALVKKGTALERLKRVEEAIECYDHAIAANRSLTVAYLCKGGACNQLERFDEALACYEQALRSQEKAGPAPPLPARKPDCGRAENRSHRREGVGSFNPEDCGKLAGDNIPGRRTIRKIAPGGATELSKAGRSAKRRWGETHLGRFFPRPLPGRTIIRP
jgi:tetratricopeptide (TPR) repeat protein